MPNLHETINQVISGQTRDLNEAGPTDISDSQVNSRLNSFEQDVRRLEDAQDKMAQEAFRKLKMLKNQMNSWNVDHQRMKNANKKVADFERRIKRSFGTGR